MTAWEITVANAAPCIPQRKPENENRGENRIQQHADEHRQHGDFRIALAPDGGVQPESYRLEHGPQHDDPQVVSGVGRDRIAGAEDYEDFVQPEQSRGGDENEATMSNTVALPSTCWASAFFPSPKSKGDQGHGAKPISIPKASTIEHEGKSHGRAGNALGAQGMTDEDSVNQIVGSLGHHADDGRNGETKQ